MKFKIFKYIFYNFAKNKIKRIKMKKQVIFFLGFLLITLTSFTKSSDWGPTGHRTTAEIATEYLKKKTKKQIDKILKGQSLAFVSTFGDEIKSDKKYNKFYSWHYVNLLLDETYQESKKNPKGDLITGINYCITVLKNKHSVMSEKVFYLKMLVHLVGDLHQPLHFGRKEDKGGNTIQVKWFYFGTNLHKVWDEHMLDKWGMSYTELAENQKNISKEQVKRIQKGTVIDWGNETHQLTKKVYASAKSGKKLKYRYSYLYFGMVREQLQKGGIRLAKILNDIYYD